MSPIAPLCSLIETGDESPALQPQPPLDNSVLADGDVRGIRHQLPAQHPAKRLLISPADIRKKLSGPQLDDLLIMLGSNDFIKLEHFLIIDGAAVFIVFSLIYLMLLYVLIVLGMRELSSVSTGSWLLSASLASRPWRRR